MPKKIVIPNFLTLPQGNLNNLPGGKAEIYGKIVAEKYDIEASVAKKLFTAGSGVTPDQHLILVKEFQKSSFTKEEVDVWYETMLKTSKKNPELEKILLDSEIEISKEEVDSIFSLPNGGLEMAMKGPYAYFEEAEIYGGDMKLNGIVLADHIMVYVPNVDGTFPLVKGNKVYHPDMTLDIEVFTTKDQVPYLPEYLKYKDSKIFETKKELFAELGL